MSTAIITIAPPRTRTRTSTDLFDILKSPRSRELLAAAEPGTLTVGELGATLGRDHQNVSNGMRVLCLYDLIERTHRAQKVYYRLTEKGRRVLAWVAMGEELGGTK